MIQSRKILPWLKIGSSLFFLLLPVVIPPIRLSMLAYLSLSVKSGWPVALLGLVGLLAVGYLVLTTFIGRRGQDKPGYLIASALLVGVGLISLLRHFSEVDLITGITHLAFYLFILVTYLLLLKNNRNSVP